MATRNGKIKSAKAAAAEKGCTYGNDRLNLADTVHESENDSVHEADNASVHNYKCILVHHRIGHMTG